MNALFGHHVWRQIVSFLACLLPALLNPTLGGCRSSPPSTSGSVAVYTPCTNGEAQSARPQVSSTTQGVVDANDTPKTPGADLVRAREGICWERPGMMTGDLRSIETVEFGPIGRQIISGQLPHDLEEFIACIKHTDGGRSVHVESDGGLPLRSCDYALLVAEAWASGTADCGYSFGDFTAYEERDTLRKLAAQRLFGIEIELPAEPYRYFDEDGVDITAHITARFHDAHRSFPEGSDRPDGSRE